jgi:hypothetical protein
VYPTALGGDALDGRLPERAFVRSLVEQPWGHRLEVVHEGARVTDEHIEVLNQILVAVQELGYSFVEGEILKVADRAIETAVLGGLGGFGVGTASKNPDVAWLATVAGWFGGLFAGSQMEKVEVIFQVRLTSRGWVLRPVSREAAPGRRAAQAA